LPVKKKALNTSVLFSLSKYNLIMR
jgi:hypothetical protein